MSKEKKLVPFFVTIYPTNGIEHVAIELNHAIAQKRSGEWEDIQLVRTSGYSDEWCIEGKRLETDQEYNLRLKQEELSKKRAERYRKDEEQRERKEYERLKKKFEKDNPTC